MDGTGGSIFSGTRHPVLKALGFYYDVRPSTRRGGVKKRPDYALFATDEDYQVSHKYRFDLGKYYNRCLTVLEAKYWGRRLNDVDRADTRDSRDPTAQTTRYLDDVHHHSEGKAVWSMLTNGKLWRLFYYYSSFRSGTYYEVDLEQVISNDDIDGFRYFYYFFSREALVPDPQSGESLLISHIKGSRKYATTISNRLRDLVFDKVFEGLAGGFIEYRRAELGVKEETVESLKELHDGCLVLLYRLLFLLYAESRSLLPLNDAGYRKKSLTQLKEDVAAELASTPREKISSRSYVYWGKFESLCNIIAKGDRALNVPTWACPLFS